MDLEEEAVVKIKTFKLTLLITIEALIKMAQCQILQMLRKQYKNIINLLMLLGIDIFQFFIDPGSRKPNNVGSKCIQKSFLFQKRLKAKRYYKAYIRHRAPARKACRSVL